MLPFSAVVRPVVRRTVRWWVPFLALATAASIVLPLLVGAAPVQAARVPLRSGSYAYVADGDPQHRLTVTARATRTNAPWVVVLHGGSWMHGSQRNTANAARLFAEHGYQVFNVSYRLDDVTFADQTRDLLAAVSWIRDHAGRFGLDLHRGAVYGFSAGGQLAAWLGGTGWFRAVVSISGVLQPQRVVDDASGRRSDEPAGPMTVALARAEEHIVGCPPDDRSWSCRDKWRDFEPQFRITRRSPPTFLAQGAADPCVPPSTASAYAYWLHRHHVPVELLMVPGLGHTDQVLFGSSHRQRSMLDFVTEHTR